MKSKDPEDVLEPEELEEDEESPYRRRPKPVHVRKKRFIQRWGRVLRWSLIGAFLLVPATLGGYRLARFLLHSPRFNVTSASDVQVMGNQYVSTEEVLGALGLANSPSSGFGLNVFRLSLDEIRGKVESIAWVRSATLTRAYPHRLIVHIVEREPIAFVNAGGELKLVDADAVLLEKPERASFAFPVVSGLDAAGSLPERRSRLALYEAFVHQMSEAAGSSGWLISEVDLADADDLRAVLVQGRDTILVHFGHQNFADRFHDFLSLIPEMRQSHDRIDSVDLRYRNQVVVNPQSAGGNSKSSARSGGPKE
jgi:cell division protein FtsQ